MCLVRVCICCAARSAAVQAGLTCVCIVDHRQPVSFPLQAPNHGDPHPHRLQPRLPGLRQRHILVLMQPVKDPQNRCSELLLLFLLLLWSIWRAAVALLLTTHVPTATASVAADTSIARFLSPAPPGAFLWFGSTAAAAGGAGGGGGCTAAACTAAASGVSCHDSWQGLHEGFLGGMRPAGREPHLMQEE